MYFWSKTLENELAIFPLCISAHFLEEARLYFFVFLENRNCDVLSALFLLHTKTNISNIASPKMFQGDDLFSE